MELSLNANVWIGLVVGLVLIGIFFIFLNTRESGGSAKGRPTFLIVGPSGAGKTSLFLKVRELNLCREIVNLLK
jgi:hypothetical protein